MGAPHFLNIEFFNSLKVTNEPKRKTLPFAETELFYAPIKSSKLLSQGDDTNRIYDLTLNTQGVDFEFEAGDTIGILPCNDLGEIGEIIEKLGLNEVADKLYKLSVSQETTKKIPLHLPEYGTIRNVLQHHVDIRSPPKKLFLRTLSHYTESKEEKQKILFLCTKEGSSDYNKFITNNLGLVDLLNEYPSCCPPVTALFEHLPSLQPRPYSISSSPLIKDQLHVTFSVITLRNGRKGVCTGWLESMIIKTENIETKFESLSLKDSDSSSTTTAELVPFYFRIPKVRFPKDPSIPVIMIGPGTGVSPFIGYLQTRLLQKTEGHTWLFFGCRYSHRDFIYKKQLQDFQKKKTLTKLFTCFSRDCNKKYVQDLIKENGKEFVKLVVEKEAVIHVCGDVKNMMTDVKCAIVDCFVKFKADLNGDEGKALKFVKSLQENSRYVEDSWF